MPIYSMCGTPSAAPAIVKYSGAAAAASESLKHFFFTFKLDLDDEHSIIETEQERDLAKRKKKQQTSGIFVFYESVRLVTQTTSQIFNCFCKREDNKRNKRNR